MGYFNHILVACLVVKVKHYKSQGMLEWTMIRNIIASYQPAPESCAILFQQQHKTRLILICVHSHGEGDTL